MKYELESMKNNNAVAIFSGHDHVNDYIVHTKMNAADGAAIEHGDIIITIGNSNMPESEVYTATEILATSGCVALTTPEAILAWDDPNKDSSNMPSLSSTVKSIKLNLSSKFITSSTDFDDIKTNVTTEYQITMRTFQIMPLLIELYKDKYIL